MSQESRQFLAALHDFRRARQRAILERIVARLTQQPADLLDYDEVRQKLGGGEPIPRGLRQIPLDAIVGSVGRYTDFTRSFLPRRKSSERRWAEVKTALPDVADFPPITVYQVGEVYFVLDGNHRVSIARQAGATHISAYVTEVETKVPLSPDAGPDELICQAKHADFLRATELDETRPEADFTVTAPGQYRVLRKQIAAQGRQLREQRGETVSRREAAAAWYDESYSPVVQIIRRQGILDHFPGRTETDLYAWISRNRDELRRSLGWRVAPEVVASDLVARRSPTPQQLVTRVKDRILEAITPRPLEPGPPSGRWRREHQEAGRMFREVLVPVSGGETGWRTLSQSLVLAQQEGSRLHGLYVVTGDTTLAEERARATRAEFAERCELAGVTGTLTVVSGEFTPQLLAHSRWADLVVYAIAHRPHARPVARLGSDFNTLVRQSSRPVLVVPGASTRLTRPLLAYDGSPKAKEALFVAAYLAGKWEVPLVVATVTEEERAAADVLRRAEAYLAARGAAATFVAERGETAEALQRTAVAHQCDFMIMGGYGFRPLLEVVLGSTVDEILSLRRWPVLICR